jgi:hypothetical protein
VLLFEESDPIDHLLGSRPRRLEPTGQARVLSFQKLDALGRDHALHSRRLQSLEPSLGLQSPPTKRSQLVTEMFYQLLELRKSGFLR